MNALFVGLIALSFGWASSISPPTFSRQYTANGVILLPYAQLREPFTAYFDGELNRSRIDYYDDLMLTLQKSGAAAANGLEFGAAYKIAYEVDANDNPQRACFQTNGTSDNVIGPQGILPDLTDFKYIGKEACPRVSIAQIRWKPHTFGKLVNEFKSLRPKYFNEHGPHCDKWQLKVKVEEKVSTYTFWARKDAKSGEYVPVHYEMFGMNTLLGSHYDQYEIAYSHWRTGNVAEDIFDIDQEFNCGEFPGPGDNRGKLTMNPIGHYLSNPDVEIKAHFEEYKKNHNVSYPTKFSEIEREGVFRHNLRFIQGKNRQQKSFKLAINHLADRTQDELKALRGRLQTKGYNGGQPFFSSLKTSELPAYIDWRLAGAVTPVRDQAFCGSCWAFGTIGTIVGRYFLKYGKQVQFSEQQLMDCSWNEGNNGCDGGEDFRVYQYAMKVGGLATDEDYGPFLGVDGKCHEKEVPKSVQLTGYVNVTQYDVDALKKALVENGPITIAINAAVRTFSFYSNGVYNDPNCFGDEDHLDHQVLLVGYGTLNNQDYWLVKNSWSTHWGNDGYVLISQKDNICGVTTSATYPLIV